VEIDGTGCIKGTAINGSREPSQGTPSMVSASTDRWHNSIRWSEEFELGNGGKRTLANRENRYRQKSEKEVRGVALHQLQ
jgi:hypothetical protein